MNTCICVPNTLSSDGHELCRAFGAQLDQLQKPDYLRAWGAIAHIFSGLHPDGNVEAGSGWPGVLRLSAAEAWRRCEAGELSNDELYYLVAAQWAGLYDRMHTHEEDEIAQRFQIASDYGVPAHA